MEFIIRKIERFWTVFAYEKGECVFDYRFPTKREAQAYIKRVTK